MCMLCQHTFNTLPILSRHIAAKHQKQDSVFFCDKCNRYFKTKWSLSTHNSRYHKSSLFPDQIGPEGNIPQRNILYIVFVDHVCLSCLWPSISIYTILQTSFLNSGWETISRNCQAIPTLVILSHKIAYFVLRS